LHVTEHTESGCVIDFGQRPLLGSAISAAPECLANTGDADPRGPDHMRIGASLAKQ
jgi:hypothetical protein